MPRISRISNATVNILDNQKLGIVIAIAPLDSEDLPTGFQETLGERARVCAVEVTRLFTVPSPGIAVERYLLSMRPPSHTSSTSSILSAPSPLTKTAGCARRSRKRGQHPARPLHRCGRIEWVDGRAVRAR